MRRLVIAIDCDDVLVDTASALIDTYYQQFGVRVSLSDFYSTDPKVWGVNDIQTASNRINSFVESLTAAVKPTTDTINCVHALSKQHELHLVSGRDRSLTSITQRMMDQYFDGCFSSMELTSHFASPGAVELRTKGKVCHELSADILIDDHLEHIESVLKEGLKEVIVFGDYPWNNAQRLPRGAVKCNSWGQVISEVRRIATK